jgi:hypothetical protein
LNGLDDIPSVSEIETDQMPFAFGQSISLESVLHPTPNLMSFIWQVYVENVDPFIKVLHVPTMAKVIQFSKGSFDKLSLGMRALLFSISLAAIASLSDSDVSASSGQWTNSILNIL